MKDTVNAYIHPYHIGKIPHVRVSIPVCDGLLSQPGHARYWAGSCELMLDLAVNLLDEPCPTVNDEACYDSCMVSR